MLLKKLNNATLWSKILKLRELIKSIDNFKERKCWNCNKELNIYDFLSDNVDFSLEYLIKLWQTDLVEFHCCECFKNLKLKELEKLNSQINTRTCSFCKKQLSIYEYSRYYNYLKIGELKSIWFNEKLKIFCNKICLRKYYNIKGISPTRLKKIV